MPVTLDTETKQRFRNINHTVERRKRLPIPSAVMLAATPMHKVVTRTAVVVGNELFHGSARAAPANTQRAPRTAADTSQKHIFISGGGERDINTNQPAARRDSRGTPEGTEHTTSKEDDDEE